MKAFAAHGRESIKANQCNKEVARKKEPGSGGANSPFLKGGVVRSAKHSGCSTRGPGRIRGKNGVLFNHDSIRVRGNALNGKVLEYSWTKDLIAKHSPLTNRGKRPWGEPKWRVKGIFERRERQ